MLEMFGFWLIYGIFTVIWYGAIVYWTTALLDKYLENLTDGDLKGYLSRKFIDPLFLRVGLHYKRTYDNVIKYNNTVLSNIVATISILGFLVFFTSYLTQFLDYITDKDKGFELQELTVQMATFLSQEATLPLLVVLVFVGLHTTLKKVYKFGKKVKPLVDSINKEEK